MKRIATAAALAALGVGLAACRHDLHTGAPVAGGLRAVATLADAADRPVGRATVSDVAGGVRVTLQVAGLAPGLHGAHLHAVGRCEAPTFATAGPHWNPTGRQHGAMNPQGPHLGDLPNVIVGTDGRGTLGAVIPGATVASLLDADGAAMIVHAGADDLLTDPSGNSGARVACGVFAPG